MKYIEVTFTMADTGMFRDLLVDALGNEGPYESFVETKEGLKAYVQEGLYDKHFLEVTVETFPVPLKYEVTEMPDKNWNEEWEKGHQAVLVEYNGGSVWVRAPFHPHRDDVNYELIIEPKMSFGTAHHPTTRMMIDALISAAALRWSLPWNGVLNKRSTMNARRQPNDMESISLK